VCQRSLKSGPVSTSLRHCATTSPDDGCCEDRQNSHYEAQTRIPKPCVGSSILPRATGERRCAATESAIPNTLNARTELVPVTSESLSGSRNASSILSAASSNWLSNRPASGPRSSGLRQLQSADDLAAPRGWTRDCRRAPRRGAPRFSPCPGRFPQRDLRIPPTHVRMPSRAHGSNVLQRQHLGTHFDHCRSGVKQSLGREHRIRHLLDDGRRGDSSRGGVVLGLRERHLVRDQLHVRHARNLPGDLQWFGWFGVHGVPE